jgi:hypothetical protein
VWRDRKTVKYCKREEEEEGIRNSVYEQKNQRRHKSK